MSKTYKGYELIKAIEDGEIKDNSEIEVHSLVVLDNIVTTIKYVNKRLIWVEGTFHTGFLCDRNYYFKIIEDEEEIDIDSIEELSPNSFDITADGITITDDRVKTINKLIKSVKQINRKLEER